MPQQVQALAIGKVRVADQQVKVTLVELVSRIEERVGNGDVVAQCAQEQAHGVPRLNVAVGEEDAQGWSR